VEFIIERPGKTERWCRRVLLRRFYISFILLSSSLLIISPMGNLALSNSFQVPYLLVLLSSWWGFRSRMQHAVHLHGLDFIFSTLYGGIRRRLCPRHLTACASPIVIFSVRRLNSTRNPPGSPLCLIHLFPNPKRVQPQDPTDRSRQRPRDWFSLYIGVCIP